MDGRNVACLRWAEVFTFKFSGDLRFLRPIDRRPYSQMREHLCREPREFKMKEAHAKKRARISPEMRGDGLAKNQKGRSFLIGP